MDLDELLGEAALISPDRLELSAWTGHIPFGASLVVASRPRILVELGTHSGTSYLAFCQAIAQHNIDTKCFAVDTWKGDEHSFFYDESVFRNLSLYHDKKYSGFSRLLRMTFDEALGYFSDGSVDLLHIDGLHTYEAVSHDYATWLPKMSAHGIIMFHDINVRERGFGVWKLWEELRSEYKHIEFTHSHGLGVLFVGPSAEEENATFIAKWNSPSGTIAKRILSRLGQVIVQEYEIAALHSNLNENQQEIALLTAQTSENETKLTELSSAATGWKQERDSLSLSLAESRSESEEILRKLDAAEATLADTLAVAEQGRVSTNAAFDQERADLERRLKDVEQLARRREEHLTGLTLSQAASSETLRRLTEMLLAAQSNEKTYIQQISTLQDLLALRTSEVDCLQGKIADFERRNLKKQPRAALGEKFTRARKGIQALVVGGGGVVPAIREWGLRGFLGRVRRAFRQGGFKSILKKSMEFRRFIKEPKAAQVSETSTSRSVVRRCDASDEKTIRLAYIVNSHDLMTQQYRVTTYAKALTRYGFDSSISRDIELSHEDFQEADILILNRVAWSQSIESLIHEFRARGCVVLFDIDDLVFDPSRINLLRFVKSAGEALRQQMASFLEEIRRTMLLCDVVTVSTLALKSEVERLGIPAFVIPNCIDEVQLRLADERSIRRSESSTSGVVRIGYFSGTKTHEIDFDVCAVALERVLERYSQVEVLVVGHLNLPINLADYSDRVRVLPLMPHDEMLSMLSDIDINLAPLEMGNAFTECKSELKLFEAAMCSVPTVASPTGPFRAVITHGHNGMLARSVDEWERCMTSLVSNPGLRQSMGAIARKEIVPRFNIATTALEAKAIYSAALRGGLRPLRVPVDTVPMADSNPAVTVVSVLYRKEGEVRYFLEALYQQKFDKRFEILLIDDASPDDSVSTVLDFEKWISDEWRRKVDLRIIVNDENLGNCGSRNKGILQARGEVVVVVDADCMFNQDFLAAHYHAHVSHGNDVVIGPINIETNGEPALAVLGRYEAAPYLAEEDSEPQDSLNQESFVNCITRNFSIRKEFIKNRLKEPLFDEDFAYSSDPSSGFGWEDVEMGFRLYKAGARISYLPDTCSIHVSHQSSANECEKPLRSLRNFKRLFEKHPEILLTSRQWSMRTYEAIIDWARSVGAALEINSDYQWLERHFSRFQQSPPAAKRHRKLRILTHRWHVPHQYELYKTGHDFTLVTGAGTGLCDQWEWDKRPMPLNCRMLDRAEIVPSDYDMALLHFDENALHPELCHGLVPLDWGSTFAWIMGHTNLPKVAICHGTPQFIGQYDGSYKGHDLGGVIEESRVELVDFLRDTTVVCNSHQSKHEWGFANSQVIWHGFAPSEFNPGTHDLEVLVMQYQAMTNRPHYNGLYIYESVKRLVKGQVKIDCLSTPDPDFSRDAGIREWARAKYQNYVREIGRYHTYLNTSIRSPMPRSRAEAMLTGVVSVSLRNHDVDMFIKNGVNGFYGDTVEELSEQLRWLKNNAAKRDRMAAASLVTARDIFNQDRYLSEWNSLLSRVVK